MNRLIGVLTAALIAPLLVACGVPDFGLDELNSEPLTVVLSGTVTTADDTPVAGATVELSLGSTIGLFGFGVSANPAVTDVAGRYTLRVFCATSEPRECPDLDLVAHLDRFERGLEPHRRTLRSIQARDSVATATLDFSLRFTRPITVVVHGRVTNAATTEPEPNATVILMESFWPFRNDSTTADSLGNYEIASGAHCALSNSSCFYGAIQVVAHKDSRGWQTGFPVGTVPGDSLDLPVDLDLR